MADAAGYAGFLPQPPGGAVPSRQVGRSPLVAPENAASRAASTARVSVSRYRSSIGTSSTSIRKAGGAISRSVPSSTSRPGGSSPRSIAACGIARAAARRGSATPVRSTSASVASCSASANSPAPIRVMRGSAG
ncbi:Uncharacterised protein [Amycolatopsis camponoti]|uniref:Uncharacterized protein n=1 Tax=Amycolatopsis camponoti TaxID=2606593 RepID=A0A6I8LXQ5_9PSEU|nr:Uncharacterised protein [Amycolatopsis camponoti]